MSGKWKCVAGFATSLIAMALSGLATSFTVYALSLKTTFSFTQSEVELVASISSAGFGLTCVEPLVHKKLGYKFSYLLILILTPTSCILMFIAAKYSNDFTDYAIIIGIFQCIGTASNNMLQGLVTHIGVNNFDKRHVGKIVGIYSGCAALGKLIYAGILELFFPNNLGGFFLSIGIIYIIVYGLCFILHTPLYTDEESDELLKTSSAENDKVRISEDQETLEDADQGSIRDMITSSYFHLLFWSSSIFHASFFAFVTNITSIAKSETNVNPMNVVYVLSVVMFISRIANGTIMDYFPSHLFRFSLLFFCYLEFLIAVVIAMVYMNAITVYIMTLLLGLSVAAGTTLPLVMLVSRFGRHHVNQIFGAFLLVLTVFIAVLQTFVGMIYDHYAPKQNPDSLFCYGSNCFYASYILFICVTILIILVQNLNFLLHRKSRTE